MTYSMRRIASLLPLASDQTDWESVYREQYPRLYNFFRFRLGSDALAEDLTADVFERAWRGRRRYRHDMGRFEAWLFGIARKVAADHLRKLGRSGPEQSLDAVAHTLAVPDHESPWAQVAQGDDFAQLVRLLAGLDARAQELLALKYGGGLTNRQIAKLTGLSESNVGTILSRSVQKLRCAWKD